MKLALYFLLLLLVVLPGLVTYFSTRCTIGVVLNYLHLPDVLDPMYDNNYIMVSLGYLILYGIYAALV